MSIKEGNKAHDTYLSETTIAQVTQVYHVMVLKDEILDSETQHF